MAVSLAAAPAISLAEADSAALVIDAGSGKTLYAYRQDSPHRPASLTKMMTLYMVFEAMREGRLRPKQTLVVSRRAANQRPSRLGLKPGRRISVEDAVLALITKSANDAAVVIAEALAGSEWKFAQRMTRRAHRLGMTQTQFRNASGLHHPDQWTNAQDMATLALALIRDFPKEYRRFSTTSFRWRGRRYENHNALLTSYDGVDGIKTGYIRQSGFNPVASAERDGRRLVGVVLGGESPEQRDWRMTLLLDHGFDRLQGNGKDQATAMQLPYHAADVEGAVFASLLEAAGDGPAATDGPESGELHDSDGPGEEEYHGPAAEEPVARSGDLWSIQVGAYGTAAPAKAAALQVAEQLAALAAGAKPAVIPVERDGTVLFRARLVGLTEDKAREACRLLAVRKFPCLAVAMDGPPLALSLIR